ncbi:FAD/NAD(P)-binding protein [Pseudoxanthomonas mexicana]|uniref:FAD/NAD(P)-binding protein n=1 Tax=Pseudoxanthomonas mexicana TaxID=128785 RepID=UPI00398BAA32
MRTASIPGYDIAIVGGGASGVLVAIHLLRQARQPLRIVLLEPNPSLGHGAAYATAHAEHLLNVPARRMSGFDDAPEDFLDFALSALPGAPDRQALGHAYLERRLYARYLQERLRQARQAAVATLEVIRQRVVALDDAGDGYRLQLEDGAALHCRRATLAVGNRPRPLPSRGTAAVPAELLLGAWDFDAVKRIPRTAPVVIVGSGLSMVDAALSLADNGHTAALHVISRHALLPLPHAPHAVADFDAEALPGMDLRRRMRHLRALAAQAEARGLPWQAVMERIRPLGQRLWQSLSPDDQRRFLRHAVRGWDVHRHRIAPQVHERLQAMRARGQLQLHRGRLDTVLQAGRCVRVSLRSRDGGGRTLDVERVINATGVEMRAQSMRNPLLDDVIGKGHAQPGPHGIGLKTAADGCLIDAGGRAQPRLATLGSLRIGCLWESIAIPELRGQAETVARLMLAE